MHDPLLSNVTRRANDNDLVDLDSLSDVASPSLLVDADRVTRNVRHMIEIVGGPDHVGRLRPHVKTHKMPAIVEMQIRAGIGKFKCATLAEAEMVVRTGGSDVLIAFPIIGPNLARLKSLVNTYPAASISVIADSVLGCELLAQTFSKASRPIRVFIDVDCGMHRTGIPWGDSLDQLRQTIEARQGLTYGGLHLYDGHLHQPLPDQRRDAALAIIDRVNAYQQRRPSPTIVAGGSPTFKVWADETKFQCSPGTPLLWDYGYDTAYPELEFEIAAVLLTRVISKLDGNRLCVDLGYKAIASEMSLADRVLFPELPDARLIGHSEEHLVIESAHASEFPIGRPLIAFPKHICPTVALHRQATVIRSGNPTGAAWPITARDR